MFLFTCQITNQKEILDISISGLDHLDADGPELSDSDLAMTEPRPLSRLTPKLLRAALAGPLKNTLNVVTFKIGAGVICAHDDYDTAITSRRRQDATKLVAALFKALASCCALNRLHIDSYISNCNPELGLSLVKSVRCIPSNLISFSLVELVLPSDCLVDALVALRRHDLHELKLSDIGVDEKCVQSIADNLPCWPHLSSIDLSSWLLTPNLTVAKSMCSILGHASLQRVSLECCDLGVAYPKNSFQHGKSNCLLMICGAILENSNIQYVNLAGNSILFWHSFAIFRLVAESTSIRELNLHGNQLDIGWLTQAVQFNQNINTLHWDVAFNWFGSNGLARALRHNPTLRKLKTNIDTNSQLGPNADIDKESLIHLWEALLVRLDDSSQGHLYSEVDLFRRFIAEFVHTTRDLGNIWDYDFPFDDHRARARIAIAILTESEGNNFQSHCFLLSVTFFLPEYLPSTI